MFQAHIRSSIERKKEAELSGEFDEDDVYHSAEISVFI